jgi:hypothetical protein
VVLEAGSTGAGDSALGLATEGDDGERVRTTGDNEEDDEEDEEEEEEEDAEDEDDEEAAEDEAEAAAEEEEEEEEEAEAHGEDGVFENVVISTPVDLRR